MQIKTTLTGLLMLEHNIRVMFQTLAKDISAKSFYLSFASPLTTLVCCPTISQILLHMSMHTLCYVVSFLFVVLFKMVAQKITCPSRSDDIGNQYDTNTKRHGFFANEYQYSNCFESGRARSFKDREEELRKRSNRSDYRRIFKQHSTVFASGYNQQLCRGKNGTRNREY